MSWEFCALTLLIVPSYFSEARRLVTKWIFFTVGSLHLYSHTCLMYAWNHLHHLERESWTSTSESKATSRYWFSVWWRGSTWSVGKIPSHRSFHNLHGEIKKTLTTWYRKVPRRNTRTNFSWFKLSGVWFSKSKFTMHNFLCASEELRHVQPSKKKGTET